QTVLTLREVYPPTPQVTYISPALPMGASTGRTLAREIFWRAPSMPRARSSGLVKLEPQATNMRTELPVMAWATFTLQDRPGGHSLVQLAASTTRFYFELP